ncbi:MAG: SUMF1/EgtB/PvdO family nonheme iron enzyme [Ruminococcus sp.]|nr:SUMF1/EgtB/PvdO family nonheme iron enzyme [Ruminococcus sp.]
MKIKNIFKKSIDVMLTVLLLFCMAYQMTGEERHEWLGIGMTALLIVHHILNIKWYGALFKGKYRPYRITLTALNIILFVFIAMTAICGMSMSIYAVPSMYGKINMMFARKMHLSMSYWSFILIGIHIGFHVKAMTAKLADKAEIIFTTVFAVISSVGLWLFLKNGIVNYIFFKTHFAFLNYEKSKSLIILENLAMLIFWTFAGSQLSKLLQKNKDKKFSVKPLIWLGAVVITGIILNYAIGDSTDNSGFDTSGWQTSVQTTTQNAQETVQNTTNNKESHLTENNGLQTVNDSFILINGGSFSMGSPDTENWRIDDEIEHEVMVSSFYVDAYETTQNNYEKLMHNNPSTFIGADMPVDNVSWLDAVQYANARSIAENLTPAYKIKEGEVI